MGSTVYDIRGAVACRLLASVHCTASHLGAIRSLPHEGASWHEIDNSIVRTKFVAMSSSSAALHVRARR